MRTPGLTEAYCPVCGKAFFHAGIWKYRLPHYRENGVLYFCSYPCFRKAAQERQQEKIRHRMRAKNDENM